MKARVLGVIAVTLGCATEPALAPLALETWPLGDGTAIELALGAPGRREDREGAVRYPLEGDLVVSVQAIDREGDRRADEPRTAASVASALVERIALGEREGDLLHERCAVGERDGECVVGWMVRDGTRYARSGAVIETANHLVWIDVAAAGERDQEVADRAQEILSSVRVVERDANEGGAE